MQGIKNILRVTLIVIMTSSVMAQSSSTKFKKEAPRYYSQVLEELPSVPGFSIAVINGDQTVFAEGFGKADLEKGMQTTPSTNYYIASSTKPFTALLAALLDKKGIISLDDPLIKYFPETKFDPAIKADRIKIRDLLNHTSGIFNEGISFRAAYSGEHDLATMVKLMKFCRPNKAGLGNYQYSNVGYNIYSIIVDQVTGRKWQDWLAKEVFQPAGMLQTSAYMSQVQEQNWPMAKAYAGLGVDEIKPVYLMKKDNTMQAAGGLVTTANDLAKWLKIQVQGGRLGNKQIFPNSIIEKSQQATVRITDREFPYNGEGYGEGWEIGTFKDQKVIYHFGGFPGFFTHVSFMPEKKLGVAVMVNDAGAGYHLMHLLANYAYDSLLETEGTQEYYQQQLAELSERLEKRQEAWKKGLAKRAERKWQLSHSFAAYSGTFYSEELGTCRIIGDDKEIKVTMGNMHCVATPYVKPETIRVELSPGSGEVIEFVWENEKLTGIRNSGNFFQLQ